MKPKAVTPTEPERPVYLTQDQAAGILQLSVKTLEKWRWERKGPPVTKVGRRVLYNETLLYEWLKQQTQDPLPQVS